MILEACVGNVRDAVRAQNLGAHQLELCDRLDLDGTTPPLDLVSSVLQAVDIPVKVILNPVPFVYTYSNDQIDNLVPEMAQLESLGVAGFVFGALTKSGLPDLGAIKRLKSFTSLPLTFHKAIDQASDINEAVALIANSGLVQFVLSSGGQPTAAQGASSLARIRDQLHAAGSEVELIAAGGITAENLADLHEDLGLNFYHGKRIV